MNSALLWKQRLNSYRKKVMKYGRYMLNDHFMIVIFFLFGFFLFQYSNWIRTIRVLEWPLLLFLSAVMAFVPFIGQLVTLLEPADVHFVSVVQQDFKPYVRWAIAYSWWLPFLCISATAGIIVPIFMQAYGSGIHYFMLLMIHLLLGKYLYFLFQKWYSEHRMLEKWWHSIIVYLLTFAILFVTMSSITASWVLMLSLVELVSLIIGKFLVERKPIFYQWNLMVDTEQRRQQRLFRFISLFVDVPFLRKSPAKRRAYLDGVVRLLSPRALHPYRYLLARTVIRSSSYLPLLLQVIVATVIVALVSETWYWILAINTLIVLLINFQLLSLYKDVNGYGMYIEKLFERDEMLDDFAGVLLQLMFGIVCIVVMISVAITRNYYLLSGLFVYSLVVVIFIQSYVKPRLKKNKKR